MTSPQHSYYRVSLIVIVLIICLLFIITSSAFFSQWLSQLQTNFTQTKNNFLSQTSKIVATTIGSPMKKDAQGNINILVVGYGWDGHAGGYLSDSMMVASFDTQEHSLSLISIPRDLIVNMSWYINKINSVMALQYNKTKDLTLAAQALGEKISDITGLKTPYYALIDFEGFRSLVDNIWGIEVDVPQSIVDRTYPWPRYSYTTFSIKAWLQHLNGDTALKYARSRHSSSDFSRSQRQQLIIKSIAEKLSQGWFSVTSLKAMYETYQRFVTTNISLDEVLWLMAYGTSVPKMHSFGYTYECNNSARKTMKAACLLYPVVQEEYNGMSGMLPIGASKGKISYYDYTQAFAQFVAYHQGAFNMPFSITLHNAVDPQYAKSFAYRSTLVSNVAINLKRYWLDIQSIETSSPSTWTIAVISGDGEYQDMIAAIQEFIPIDEIKLNEATVDLSGNALPNHIDLYVGNDFMKKFWSQKFNTYSTHAQ